MKQPVGYAKNRGGRHRVGGVDRLGPDQNRKRSAEAGFDAHMVKLVDVGALSKLLAERAPPSI